MTKDPVEEFLVEIEGLVNNRHRYDDWQLDHMELEKVLSHQKELVPKLLALVRVYREVNQNIIKNCPMGCMEGDCGAEWEMEPKPCPVCPIARAAEEKAKEIVQS